MIIKNQKGQTAVEYVLMLMVVMFLIFNVLGIVRDRFMGDPENCDSSPKPSVICIISGKFSTSNWKYFPLSK